MGWTKCCNFKEIPHASGCYAIFNEGRPIYIGQSENLRTRLRGHRLLQTEKGFMQEDNRVEVRIRVIFAPGDWLRREWRLIRRLRPINNARWPDRMEDKLMKWAAKEARGPLRRVRARHKSNLPPQDRVLLWRITHKAKAKKQLSEFNN